MRLVQTAIVLSLLVMSPMHAQADEATEVRADDARASSIAQARKLFQEATEHLAAGNAAVGRDLLRQSLALHPSVATRYNLGVALRTTGQTTEAIATFEGLRHEPTLSSLQQQRLQQQIDLASSELATVNIRMTGVPRASIEIDGRRVGDAVTGSIVRARVDAGSHVVEARADGSGRARIQVGRGETIDVALHVVPAPERAREKKKRRRKLAGWLTGASAVVAGGVIAAVLATRSNGAPQAATGDTPVFTAGAGAGGAP